MRSRNYESYGHALTTLRLLEESRPHIDPDRYIEHLSKKRRSLYEAARNAGMAALPGYDGYVARD